MPVLLLAQGDARAKDMLKQAIRARYGLRPPAIETLHIDFKGRARARLGPVSTWLSFEATTRFLFPMAVRWDYSVRSIGLEIQRGTDAFDGSVYRRLRGNGAPERIENEDTAASLRRRLWAIAALLLTPLGEAFVTLSAVGESGLEAASDQIGGVVAMQFRANHLVESVAVDCLNPDNDRQQRFTLRVSEEQGLVDDFMLPHTVSAFWDNDPYFEMQPVRVETNPQIENTVFSLS